MAFSSLRVDANASTILPFRHSAATISDKEHFWKFSLMIPLLTLSFAVFFVPESPDQLASICEKHNSVTACQVW